MAKSSFITEQLRESAPYLKDAGWHQTATLVVAAAAEIELLSSLLEKAGMPAEPVAVANQNETDARIRAGSA